MQIKSKKILITGGNGYIAKNLYNSLSNKYIITCITSQDVDLTDFQSINQFFQNKYFDVIIHCAVQGGSRLKIDSYKEMDVNLVMYYNLLQHKSFYSKLIHFGSGAEIFNSESPYGLSKKVISKSILEQENFYNIRIFGVFDENELNTRFIKGNIKRYIKGEPILIHQNKLMDFFYIKDLISLVDYYIQNQNIPKEIDCSYSKSYSLLNIANIINNLHTHKVDIIIEQKETAQNYCGYPNTLLNYIGLEYGIKEVYKKLKNEY